MVKGFWKQLERPIIALAPMANVTDAAFRRVIAKRGKPDVMWTEFVSCDGLVSEGRESLLTDLWFTDAERPIVAQFFGSNPESFYTCALLAQELGFDGIDINMGCPDKSVEKQGAGAALIRNPEHAKAILRATQRGAGKLPVSVKTRIGYSKDTLEEWLKHLLDAEPAAITVHARTRKEMSLVPARWEAVARASALVRSLDTTSDRTLILGNGDVKDLEDAYEKARTYEVDGVMIGRGIFGNPWLFSKDPADTTISVEKRLAALVEHTYLFEQLFAGRKHFDIMKKHYKAYVSGFDGAKELRVSLMELHSALEVERCVGRWLAREAQ